MQGQGAMTNNAMRQIRGLNDLVYEAVDAGVAEVAKAYHAIARTPFAILKQVGCIALPVWFIERTHDRVADTTFQSIRAINYFVSAATTQLMAFIPDGNEDRGTTAP
jgi:hypothetical protein